MERQSQYDWFQLRRRSYQNMTNAILSVKELCGLPPITSLKQCILTLSSRLVNSNNVPSVTLSMKDNFPYLEPLGPLTDVQKKVLAAYDLMIKESRFLIETADTIYDKIVQCQKAGMEFREEIPTLGSKEGLKDRKLSKASESFAWNITVLKLRWLEFYKTGEDQTAWIKENGTKIQSKHQLLQTSEKMHEAEEFQRVNEAENVS